MRRPSAPLVISLLALFIALGGTSLAASHYLLTSTTQIKPSVLRALRGREGPAGPQGPPGPTGQPGLAGSASSIANLCDGINLAKLEIASSEPNYESLTQKALTKIYAWAC